MQLSDNQLLNFVGRIKLPRQKKSDCRAQIEGLERNVRGAINKMPSTDIKVTNTIRAGSWKKGTSLKPWGDNPMDVDMVFCVDAVAPDKVDWDKVRDHIIEVLREAYPSKSPEDFSKGTKTVGVAFQGTGLDVDIVPFVKSENSPYGLQPRKKLNSRETVETSVEKQLDFIDGAKRQWISFTAAVRMVKWWKNQKELELPSFAVELLFAHLLGLRRVGGTIEDGLIEFFKYLKVTTHMRVGFAGAIGALSSRLPVIADPTNNANNVLAKVDSAEWDDIIENAGAAFEALSYAQHTDSESQTDGLWREVFDQFNKEGN